MPIADLQRSLTELGRIRLGKKKENGKPARLDTFRFTSPVQHLIEEIAALYGGEVAPWNGSGRGKQWETITTATIIPVFLPRQKIDPWYEQWGKEVCMRRCDGIRDSIHDQPCDCTFSQAGKPNRCKPTTRLNVMLADVVGLGQWRVETHGIYAAGELSTLSNLLEGVQIPLPGRLLLENRTSKQWDREEKKVVVKDFNVPVVLVDAVTARQIQIGGDALTQALRVSQGAAEIEAPQQRPALAAAPQTAPASEQDIAGMLAAIAEADTPEQMMALASAVKQLGQPEELTTAWKARRVEIQAALAAQQEHERGPEQTPPAPPETSAEPEAPSAPPVAPPSVPETTSEPPAATPAQPQEGADDVIVRRNALMGLLGEAGAQQIGKSELERIARDYCGGELPTLSIEQMGQLQDYVRGGGR